MRLSLLLAALALFAVGCAEEPAPVEAPIGEAEVVTEPTEDLTDDDFILDDSLSDGDMVVDDSTLIDGAVGEDL